MWKTNFITCCTLGCNPSTLLTVFVEGILESSSSETVDVWLTRNRSQAGKSSCEWIRWWRREVVVVEVVRVVGI